MKMTVSNISKHVISSQYATQFQLNTNRDEAEKGIKTMVNTTVSGKKDAIIFLPLTLPNADRFSKFFHPQT